MCKEYLFNFVREDIKNHCDNLDTTQKQLDYLHCVLSEYKMNPPRLDQNTGLKPPLTEYLQTLIDAKERELETEKVQARTIKQEDLIWWKGTPGQLIYLFELLVNAQLIDNTFEKRKYKILSLHFKDKNGKSFIDKNLNQSFQNLVYNKTDKPRRANEIENMVSEIKKDQ